MGTGAAFAGTTLVLGRSKDEVALLAHQVSDTSKGILKDGKFDNGRLSDFFDKGKSNALTANAASYAGLKMDLKTTEAANDVVESLRRTGNLPQNYVDKAQASVNGWKPGKALNNTTPGGQIGGDVFDNPTNILPASPGRVWREADIGLDNTMSRGNQPGTRLLYSNDGLLYITTDHYETATSIGKWR